ncbi:MAG TPA: tripartite tricarboxylate transporter substrate-binding protein, partial [Burkholderiales bacterium]|nr:tripartite tricarboxylate transporter substrate-binding protein [Burkholderiales bacterium]
IVARAVGQELAKRIGQTVLVENRTGAGGNVGSETVAKAAPDGYTLLIASPANTINPSLYTKMPYDPMRDLAPIGLIGSVPTVLIANRSLPVQNVKELVALARSQPGALTYGSGGSGTTEHLAGEMFKSAARVDILHVPYKGGAQVMTDLLGGADRAHVRQSAGSAAAHQRREIESARCCKRATFTGAASGSDFCRVGIPGAHRLGMVGPHGSGRDAERDRHAAQPGDRRRVGFA